MLEEDHWLLSIKISGFWVSDSEQGKDVTIFCRHFVFVIGEIVFFNDFFEGLVEICWFWIGVFIIFFAIIAQSLIQWIQCMFRKVIDILYNFITKVIKPLFSIMDNFLKVIPKIQLSVIAQIMSSFSSGLDKFSWHHHVCEWSR